jgi:organic radical activating enzyme
MFWKPDPNKKYKKIASQIGKGFCTAKWNHVSIHLHTGDNHSCYHPGMHKVSLEELKENPSALHNSKFKKEQRKLMLEDERPNECSYCWALEDVGELSDRHFRSAEFEQIEKGTIDKIKSMPWDADVMPKYLEVNFGNECQMKCSYCTPSISSAWENEFNKFGDYPLDQNVNRRQYHANNKNREHWIYKEKENPYIEAFWKWFPEVYKQLHTLRITGGEPLLSSNVFKVMEYMEQNPNPNLEFSVNTNMCVPQRNLNKFIDKVTVLTQHKKIDRFQLFTSIDTWGEQAEYIRDPMNIELWEKNVDTFMNAVPKAQCGLMITVNFMSVHRFKGLLAKILEWKRKYNTLTHNRFTMDTPYLIEPPHLSLQILDDEHLDVMYDCLEFMKQNTKNWNFNYFSDTDVTKWERVIKWAESNRFKDSKLIAHQSDFIKFVNEYDKRRGTNFLKTFPELTDFYNKCATRLERKP